uniref:Thioredoxin domain-containing protein n=1 Tax=Pelodiscus sinensis TaxID=13735 RepID=K7FVK1_PELSI
DWSPAVNLGVFDCAEVANQKSCGTFGITGFPTLKFFKAFSKSPDDGIRLTSSTNTVQALRQGVIASLETHKETWPPACPPALPLVAEEIRGFFQRNNVTYLALIFETSDSFVGREVTMDMLQYENVAVRRALSSEEALVKQYGPTTFPAGFLLVRNGTYRAQCTPTGAPSPSVLQPQCPPAPPCTPAPVLRATTWCSHRARGSSWQGGMAAAPPAPELQAARNLALNGNIGKGEIPAGGSGVSLRWGSPSLRSWYFPGRPFVRSFLRSVDSWLRSMRGSGITYQALERVLTNRRQVGHAELTWVGCQGSEPHFRGYPCSLWILFHVLTVQAAQHGDRGPHLPQDAVASPPAAWESLPFLQGCSGTASEAFVPSDFSRHGDRGPHQHHLRLHGARGVPAGQAPGTETEDPTFPKMQWPPPDLCPRCHGIVRGRHVWDEATTLRFLKAHYSSANIIFD